MNKPALMEYLQLKSPLYFGKCEELRGEVRGWLNYIPATFPHYTRHSVKHSDEIVVQLSKLLFTDDNVNRPIIELSAVEAYILIASALLHDAGMVCSDSEKVQILSSDEWVEWATGGAAKERWAEIERLRGEACEPVQHFVVDLQTRFLIAEFVRARHHSRSAEILTQHSDALGRCDLGDKVLRGTIAAVCEGHGLDSRDLDDVARFPTERDIRQEKVNVRLLACLLRLADLLDISSDRACPMLMSAACPLPADSLAHWSQYQRITHRLTCPERIEITAECENQEEHRVLQDWCQWIVNETQKSKLLLSSSSRHKTWEAPLAKFRVDGGNIDIRPHETATYIPTKWQLALDTDAVLHRLINDVYETKYAFVRELIQNAADASRCQVYLDLTNEGGEMPEFPSDLPQEILQKYPITIRLMEKEFENKLAGKMETRQVMSIEDYGVGMDKDVITKYFLQVGRSFYTAPEFRREFRFNPTSRFGIGFLSVFAVSDNVAVETWKPSSASGDGPMRLTLTGPRNYLLTEKCARHRQGTRIEVVLNDQISDEGFTDQIRAWCRRLEFPVKVDNLGESFTISSETIDQNVAVVPDLSEESASFEIRAHPFRDEGVIGEIYIFVNKQKSRESWVNLAWANSQYLKEFPSAEVPPMPDNYICWHGVSESGDIRSRGLQSSSPIVAQVDVRGRGADFTLSRSSSAEAHCKKVVEKHVKQLITEHLEEQVRVRDAPIWPYIHSLAKSIKFKLPEYWLGVEGAVPFYVRGSFNAVSMSKFYEFEEFAISVRSEFLSFSRSKSLGEIKQVERDRSKGFDFPVICSMDLRRFAHTLIRKLMDGARVREVTSLGENYWVVRWIRDSDDADQWLTKTMLVASFSNFDGLGALVHPGRVQYPDSIILNGDHRFARWLVEISRSAMDGASGLTSERVSLLLESFEKAFRYSTELESFLKYLDRWRESADIPSELLPPQITAEEFPDPWDILNAG